MVSSNANACVLLLLGPSIEAQHSHSGIQNYLIIAILIMYVFNAVI